MAKQPSLSQLRHLAACFDNREQLSQISSIVQKIQKCCMAVDRNFNLAEVLSDETNLRSLKDLFGTDGLDVGLQLILKLAAGDFSKKSWVIQEEIDDRKRVDFLYRSMGGWKQFDMVFAFLAPETAQNAGLTLVNPQNAEHWKRMGSLPRGTLITVYLRQFVEKRSRPQESLALERIHAIFETVQTRKDLKETEPAPVVKMTPKKVSAPSRRPALTPSRFGSGTEKLSLSFQVVVHKMDTFIHAGNAQLILTHLNSYPGRVQFFVLRERKAQIQLDADSIWGAEIRNGETVVYEFYGPKPSEEFVKELAHKTNKYTQMDKLAHG